MCKRLTYFMLFMLALAVTSTQAALIHHWKLDDVGTTAVDSAGDLNGAIKGPMSITGKVGNALNFDGSDDLVEVQNFTPPLQGTVIFWINPALAKSKERILGAGGDYEIWLRGNGELKNELFDGGSTTTGTGPGALNANQWNHIAATYDSTTTAVEIYLDGELKTAGTANVPSTPTETTLLFGHRTGASGSERYGGLLDDIQIYDEVLNADQIKWLYDNPGKVIAKQLTASNPSPADGQTDVPRDADIGWKPGVYADKHDVYFGTHFNDVNDADTVNPLGVLVSQGQDANTYDPAGVLDFGQTYYWRVDEVNAPPDSTIFKGNVWQFTTEPFAYPIAGTSITATASSQFNENSGPEKTIDGSGLDDNDLHSTNETSIWLSSMAGPQPTWIQYEFDRVYKLHQMWVWNFNQVIEPVVGLGFKDVTIEYSTNGTDWTVLADVSEFARAPGQDGYAHNTTVDLAAVPAKYVRLTANSNWGGFVSQYGLSEVRFFHIPVVAREPAPASGTANIGVDNVTLSWRAGREAASHNLYFSTDEQAVIDGTISAVSIPADSSYINYDTGELELGQTYHWKVNEVNEAETPTIWQGDVWNFSTQEYLMVEDFEDYNDFEPDRIFDTWKDGWNVPENSSQVGYAEAPFAETVIVHGGKQSMPLSYDNSTASYSEATANVANLAIGRDWTKYGIKTLSLWFYGDPTNAAEQMYIKVNGVKVVYDGDVADIQSASWHEWNIDLASLGMDLQNVTEMGIGFGDEASTTAGGSGVVYFDDIRLY